MTGRTRAPNGASSIYQGQDGKWHGRVTMGTRDDGRPDRRHLESKSRAEVTRKVRELEKQRDSGRVQRPGRAWTVEQWLTHWVEHIAAPVVSENTLASYRVAVRVHLVPGIGAHRLDRLQPEHLERLYVRMMAAGSSAGTAHQAHRTARTALGEAVRRGYLRSNPATLAKPPRLSETEVEPFSIEDVQRILTAVGERRNGPGGPSHSRLVFAKAKRSASAGRTSISTPARLSSGGAATARGTSTDAAAPAARTAPATAVSAGRSGPTPATPSRRTAAVSSGSRPS